MFGWLAANGIRGEALFIVGALGALELVLWGISEFIALRQSKEQMELLEDLVTTLVLREQEEKAEPISKGHSYHYNDEESPQRLSV